MELFNQELILSTHHIIHIILLILILITLQILILIIQQTILSILQAIQITIQIKILTMPLMILIILLIITLATLLTIIHIILITTILNHNKIYVLYIHMIKTIQGPLFNQEIIKCLLYSIKNKDIQFNHKFNMHYQLLIRLKTLIGLLPLRKDG